MKKILFVIFLLTSSSTLAQTKFVTTIHPFKQILKEVIGNHGEVYGILPPGASPHTYELRPSDVRFVSNAKALFFGSENLDAWALKFPNSNQIELITLVAPDALIYFQDEHPEHQSEIHHDREQDEGHHHSGVDPHFWTDPLTVKTMLPALVKKLCVLDPAGCEKLKSNSDRFSRQLDSLHIKLKAMLAPIQGSNVMISHPFFQYFFQRYGINLVGIIEATPGKEPTPKQLKGYIEQVEQKQVKAIFDHIQLPDRASKLVAEAAGLKVCHLDPLGGVSGRQSYDELLLYNAKLILEALQ
ncbi:metal ABC transporter substrate-binding protein [candidate division KSB1 bacterium]|nr:metal ABC transporter substrate-binding protein [candidate division KSB1 bacterium]